MKVENPIVLSVEAILGVAEQYGRIPTVLWAVKEFPAAHILLAAGGRSAAQWRA